MAIACVSSFIIAKENINVPAQRDKTEPVLRRPLRDLTENTGHVFSSFVWIILVQAKCLTFLKKKVSMAHECTGQKLSECYAIAGDALTHISLKPRIDRF